MQYWFVKSPFKTRTWADVIASDLFQLYGIRSHASRNNIAKMQKGDKAIWYNNKFAFGVLEVCWAPFQDPTSENNWLAVDFIPNIIFSSPVAYKELKMLFEELPVFIKQPRTTVTKLTKKEYEIILEYRHNF